MRPPGVILSHTYIFTARSPFLHPFLCCLESFPTIYVPEVTKSAQYQHLQITKTPLNNLCIFPGDSLTNLKPISSFLLPVQLIIYHYSSPSSSPSIPIMSPSARIQDIRQLCNLYIADVPPNDVLALYILIAVINAVIFFSLWLPLIISLTIQSHHRLKRLSGILLRHRSAWFIVWPFLHASCGLSLILQGLVLHAGLACRHPGVEKSLYSLTPLAGWLLYAIQCAILVASALTIGVFLRREQKKARKGKGRAATGGEDVERYDAEPFAMPPQERTLRTFRVLRPEDKHHRPSTVTTNSSASSRPEYFCWEGIEDLIKDPINMVAKCRTRDPRDADPGFTYAMARRTMGRTSDKITTEDMQRPTRVRLPIGRNAEGSSKDVERLVARRNALAADVQGFPFPCMPLMPPPRCLSRAGLPGRNGFQGYSGRPSGKKRAVHMGSGSFVPSRPSPLRLESVYRPTTDNATAALPGSCSLDKLPGKGKPSENAVSEMALPRSEDMLISLSPIPTSSSTSGLEPLQRCPRLPSPNTSPISWDSGVGLSEID